MGPIHVFIAHTHSTAQHEEKAQDCTGHSREAASSFLYMCIKGLRAATKLWWTHWPSRVPFACRKAATAAKKNEKQREEFVFIFLACIYGHYSMPRSSHKSWKCIFTTVPVTETWQVLPAPNSSSSNSRKAQHENCDQQQCFLFSSFSSTLYLPPPLCMGVAHIEHAFAFVYPPIFCVCLRVCLQV